jgi:hypothetical protein
MVETAYLFLLIVTFALALLGTAAIITGIIILVTRATGKEIRALTVQTSRMAQKGIAEDVAGLVGNATSLIEAVNQLVRTTAGIGVFLVLTGPIMILASVWLVFKLF